MVSSKATLLAVALLCVLVPHVAAFGAGNIANYSYLSGKAFRHGDLESVLRNLPKQVGPLDGFVKYNVVFQGIFNRVGENNFSILDVKRIYFGNWLRDYSQAMDVTGLSRIKAQTLLIVISALGFMTFGLATEEFQVTFDRLGVYLPVEHIDNPKGYPEKVEDARTIHPGLRPPVNQLELEIDQHTGMKSYIATEGQSWDTSAAHVRRTLAACIRLGRQASGGTGPVMWEAYRLLGTALHTLEDLLAHSNWCELGLLKLGHSEVFCYVGDNIRINTPNGPAPPLTTGTFGSDDFIHSLLGEASDHLGAASVFGLREKLKAHDRSVNPIDQLNAILGKLPVGHGLDDKLARGMELQEQAARFNPNDYAPEGAQQLVFEVLKWHDEIAQVVTEIIQHIPALEYLLGTLADVMTIYVYATLEPLLSPILQNLTAQLQEASAAITNTPDQQDVFTNPGASNPSHSLLSKDHFELILNEPAGKVAIVVVKYTVKLIVQAWCNPDIDERQTINQARPKVFHHPYYASGSSQVQKDMAEELSRWFSGLGSEGSQTLQLLTKESVRTGRNKRAYVEHTAPNKVVEFAKATARSLIHAFIPNWGFI
ncbi:heterokaryon incompatibility Het-C [Ceratobasidium sp. AG-I]|nr:heterokaryon incompatibility Het-C [Ceratobasidium sp. AG-I]